MRRTIDVTAAAGLDEPAEIAAEIYPPVDGAPPRALLVCLPGGGMNRRYFDLPAPAGEPIASFAQAMTARGYLVALLDPLGVGESTLPADPYRLHPDQMAAALTVAARRIIAEARAGTLVPDLPPAAGLPAIGVGHSFGALLTIVQQAADPLYDALALYGFQTTGVLDYTHPDDLALPPAEARARLIELARLRMPEPFLTLTPPPSKRPVSAAIATDRILATVSMTALLPDLIATDAAAITVPILLGFGDGDLHPNPRGAPAVYAACPDITLLVLPETRHNHFIYPSRTHLFERTARWLAAL